MDSINYRLTLKIIGLITLFCVCMFIGYSISSEYLNSTVSIIIGIISAAIITSVWLVALVLKKGSPPRKYAHRKVAFAPSEQVWKYSEILSDFFEKVLGDYIKAILFVSDYSSLKDYEPKDRDQAKKQREAIIRRTLEIYHIDITEAYDGPLYKVFEMIKDRSN